MARPSHCARSVKSVLHEALRELFAKRPELLPDQLAPLLVARIDLPSPCLVAIDSELTDPRMPQLLPDAVLACPDAQLPRLALVVEVHLAIDKTKRRVWPQYVSSLYARLGCPVILVVVTPSASVERWASAPIHLGPAHSMTPVVLGPAAIPLLEHDQIERAPLFGMLSTLAHMKEPSCAQQALWTLEALSSSGSDPDGRLADILVAALTAAVRRRMEALMPTIKQEYHSEWGKKAFAQGVERGLRDGREEGREEGRSAGQAHALLTILRSRNVDVPGPAVQRIEAERDAARLDAWIARALTAASIEDVFADE